MLLLPLVYAASRFAFRLAHGGRFDAVAFLDLTVVILLLSVLWSHLSPPGSASRRWASYALLAAASSLMVGVAWRSVGPPTLEAVVWGMAAFGVLFLLLLNLSLAQARLPSCFTNY